MNKYVYIFEINCFLWSVITRFTCYNPNVHNVTQSCQQGALQCYYNLIFPQFCGLILNETWYASSRWQCAQHIKAWHQLPRLVAVRGTPPCYSPTAISLKFTTLRYPNSTVTHGWRCRTSLLHVWLCCTRHHSNQHSHASSAVNSF